MKKGMNPISGSWDTPDEENQEPNDSNIHGPDPIQVDDTPLDPLSSGPRHHTRLREMEVVTSL